MKTYLLIFAMTMFALDAAGQFPNPPDKLCYDYDRSGNRTKQKPAWVNANPPIDCTPNNPDGAIMNDVRIWIVYLDGIFRLEGLAYWGIYPVAVIAESEVNRVYSNAAPPISVNGNQQFYPDARDIVYAVLVPSLRGTPIDSGKKLEISVVPNPVYGQFKLEQDGFDKETATIYIYDNKGVLLFERNYDDGEVNISGFAQGSYIIVLKDKDYQKATRIQKNE